MSNNERRSAREKEESKMTTVGDLREIAESILEQLEGLDEDEEIYTRSNTCGMGSVILETYGGFIDYEDIVTEREYNRQLRYEEGEEEEEDE